MLKRETAFIECSTCDYKCLLLLYFGQKSNADILHNFVNCHYDLFVSNSNNLTKIGAEAENGGSIVICHLRKFQRISTLEYT